MLKLELNAEVVEKGEELGYVVSADTYENEGQAEQEGFYWYDEIDRWVNVEKMNENM